jgi:hypothetical protein
MVIVVVGGVENRIVGGQIRRFIAPMQIHTVSIKESCKYTKEKIHIDRHQSRKDGHRQCSHELVRPLVCNHGKWGGIEEGMMMLVNLPKGLVTMS